MLRWQDTENRPPKRSPLKVSPLRNPGQSLDEQIQDVIWDKVFPLFSGVSAVMILAGMEWWHTLVPSPPQPIPVSLLALAVVGYSAPRFYGALKEVRSLRQGRDGEKAVAEQLEELRVRGCRVFHDVPAPGFNLDHVLISERGIYVIETKTLSKPTDRDAQIVFDGREIRIDGFLPQSDYLAQARAERDWLRDFLHKETGKKFPVRGILVFPGWFIEPVGNWRRSDVWVLTPKGVGAFLANEPTCIRPEDVALAASRVSDHIRRG